MTNDLVKRLRAKHNDTWPLKIGHGDLINDDGPEAADRIEKLEAALRKIVGNGNATGCNPQIMCDIARKALEGKDD